MRVKCLLLWDYPSSKKRQLANAVDDEPQVPPTEEKESAE